MAEQVFIVEDGTLTKYETDDYVKEVYIPDSVTTIETWAFAGCEAMTEITIPESVTEIGPWAIGYKKLLFLPYWDPVPFGKPVLVYGVKGQRSRTVHKDNNWCCNEHITEFREIETGGEKERGS